MNASRSTMRSLCCGLLLCSIGTIAFTQAPQTLLSANLSIPPATPASYGVLADEVETNLQRDVLSKWFPAALDTARGGFHQNFAEDWTRTPPNDRALVYQSRLIWIASQAAMRYPNQAAQWQKQARHGLDFLLQTMWDAQNGGFYWGLDDAGQPVRNGEKHVYGIAFAIYAASANYHATKDARALELAQRAYRWLDAHAHDARNGGYYEALTRAGQPILNGPAAPSNAVGIVDQSAQNDEIGTRYGYKSMNTHIHLLEALTALHEVWPDAKLRGRLQEVFAIVRDRIVVEQAGAMNLFFTPDWKPIPDHDSFGHDIETAYLLAEASAALGRPDDAKTWKVARRLVDHALDFGWDAENGGFYDAGPTFGSATTTAKVWWVQAEGLNALLLMHERFGRQTPRYWNAFVQQWRFIQNHQVDAQHGGWHPEVTREGVATPGRAKSDGWTEAYHQGRALLNVSATLRHLASKR